MPNSDVSSRNARAWGQGLMTEALHAALKFSFEEVELNRIQAIIDSKNTRSMNLFTGLASRKKIFGKGSYFNRQFRDDVIFSLLRNG